MEYKDDLKALGEIPRNQASMVDLHGLSPERSQQRVNWHLGMAEQTQTSSFRFVTGRGNHVNSQGERGTLFREFQNWLAEDNLKKIDSIKKYDGYYEINMKPTKGKKPFDLALEQLSQQWLTNNFNEVKERAEKGDAFYQNLLGHCYQYGIIVGQDYKEAVSWYQKSADNKNAFSQYALGGCYWQGIGVRQNDQKAIELFKQAALQHFPWAFHQLGDVYRYGIGVNEDIALAISHYQQASDLGLDIAKRKLAHLYFSGKGIPKDLIKAFQLYKEVADNGDPHSAYNVACAYLHGDGVKVNHELAFSYAKQAADKNDPDAQYLLFEFYCLGTGVKPSLSLGLEYLERSAANNFKHALLQLAFHPSVVLKQQTYEYLLKAAKAGQIVAQAFVLEGFPTKVLPESERRILSENFWKQDDEEILSILVTRHKFVVIDAYMMTDNLTKKQSAKILRLLHTLGNLDYPQVFGRLGSIYKAGTLVKADSEKAAYYWSKGAKLGDAHCLCALGYYYEEKAKSDKSSYQQAFNYHEQAATKEDANSCNQLGLLYRDGNGITKNIDKAVACFQEAMRLDSAELKFKQQDGLYYNSVFPHAAYNLAALYWDGDENFPREKEKAIIWFIKSAEAGHEEAKKTLRLLGISSTDNMYQQISKLNFWERSHTNEKPVQTSALDLLKEFSGVLGLKAAWKITKRDEAWCYIEAKELAKLEGYSLGPFVIRKTQDQRHLLLLEKMSTHDLSQIIDDVKTKASIAFNN